VRRSSALIALPRGAALRYNKKTVNQAPQPIRIAERRRPDGGSAETPDVGRLPVDTRARVTVLVVDDVPDVADMYALFFKHIGIRVLTAHEGQSALAVVRADRPDIIVLDMAMPGLTGWDVLRELKGAPQTREIPILVLSGQEVRDSALRAGANAYVEKPCLPDKLFGELMRVLYGSH